MCLRWKKLRTKNIPLERTNFTCRMIRFGARTVRRWGRTEVRRRILLLLLLLLGRADERLERARRRHHRRRAYPRCHLKTFTHSLVKTPPVPSQSKQSKFLLNTFLRSKLTTLKFDTQDTPVYRRTKYNKAQMI